MSPHGFKYSYMPTEIKSDIKIRLRDMQYSYKLIRLHILLHKIIPTKVQLHTFIIAIITSLSQQMTTQTSFNSLKGD